MSRVRIDKWLWAARFFKTRSLASHACELGRISVNGQPAKASRELHEGDRLLIRNEGGDFDVAVLVLSETRGPAATAQTLYQETPESQALRAKLAAERKAMLEFGDTLPGKPSKRDRRDRDRFRGRV